MEPRDYIAVAQVYATLALVEATKAVALTFVQGKDDHLAAASTYSVKSKAALKAAGVSD